MKSFSIPTQKQRNLLLLVTTVPSVGIEPTLQLPQSCVLSIERRRQTANRLASFDENTNYLRIPRILRCEPKGVLSSPLPRLYLLEICF